MTEAATRMTATVEATASTSSCGAGFAIENRAGRSAERSQASPEIDCIHPLKTRRASHFE